MTAAATETLSVVVERELAFPPEKIWRALTQPHLMAEWLMKTDFEPVAGRKFGFTADWGSLACQVLAIEPPRILAYSWGGMGVETVVTWTLTPTGKGTHLRMEQTGFPPSLPQAYRGASAGWPRFLDALDGLLARID